ncbi:metallopeptidase family protein [Roseicyclus sp. F158]|uniref:Metallopeptidase family protein n=1 Tax=Tropicimonas omnivorans TaxID=3075590 RepID=A0ABU3DDK0_9RHOB|nr:metallopeptidase family protein [Roseicyclus sp. F158]MDT0681789.1 metallopeptidase family protein [Roseicyclus sp. F158]
MDWSKAEAPLVDEIAALAEAARAALPPPFRSGAADIAIRVVDFPDEEMLAELDIESPFELTGLYDGIPQTERSVFDQPSRPDVIWLFRRPILDEWAERGTVTLGELVTHILVHEIAHHFGWSDDDIASVDEWWT